MDTNTDTETEGEYVAALTERDREIYNRGYTTGILARGLIHFGAGTFLSSDPRTHRGADHDAGCDADCDKGYAATTTVPFTNAGAATNIVPDSDACSPCTETRAHYHRGIVYTDPPPGTIPDGDPRTHRDGDSDSGTYVTHAADCRGPCCNPYSYAYTPDAFTDCDHDNLACTHVNAREERRRQAQAHLDNDCPYTHDDTDCDADPATSDADSDGDAARS